MKNLGSGLVLWLTIGTRSERVAVQPGFLSSRVDVKTQLAVLRWSGLVVPELDQPDQKHPQDHVTVRGWGGAWLIKPALTQRWFTGCCSFTFTHSAKFPAAPENHRELSVVPQKSCFLPRRPLGPAHILSGPRPLCCTMELCRFHRPRPLI